MFTSRAIPALALVLAAILAQPAPGAMAGGNLVGTPDPMPVTDANARLKSASSLLSKSSTGVDAMERAMKDLADAYDKIGGKERERSAFRRKTEAFWLRALTIYRAKKGEPDVNRLNAVNVRAAEHLGKAARVLTAKEARVLSHKIRGAITKDITKNRKPEQWDPGHLLAAFGALALLNDHESLLWMANTYRHSKEREIPFLVAAHRAMVRFRDVKGPLRRTVCDKLISGYAGVESAAERSSNTASDTAKKRIWDRLRLYMIPVLQHYAGKPTNEKGEALSTVNEFQAWWKDHKDARDRIWKD